MRGVVQRVSKARVLVDGEVTGQIKDGLLLFLGVAVDDSDKDADYLLNKVLNLRVFEDSEGRMNLSLLETNGGLLAVSQFTLYGDTRKGMRPSFIRAAGPAEAEALYEYFVRGAREQIGVVETGRFRAMMDVELVNDGPVTILLDSRREF